MIFRIDLVHRVRASTFETMTVEADTRAEAEIRARRATAFARAEHIDNWGVFKIVSLSKDEVGAEEPA